MMPDCIMTSQPTLIMLTTPDHRNSSNMPQEHVMLAWIDLLDVAYWGWGYDVAGQTRVGGS